MKTAAQGIHQAVEQLVAEHGQADFLGSERRRYEIGRVCLEWWTAEGTSVVYDDCRPVFVGRGENHVILEEGDWIDEVLGRAGGSEVSSPIATPDADGDAVWERVGCGWWTYTKDDGTGYVTNGLLPYCSCWGYRKWGHCKHIDRLEGHHDEQRSEIALARTGAECRRAA
jgi:hypothetical protein